MVTEKKLVVSREFRLQMEGYGLTTAEIHYHLPIIRGYCHFTSGKNTISLPEFRR